MYKKSFLLLASIWLASHSVARPVSYPGGWTLMLMNEGGQHSAHLHFSPSVKHSLGYKVERLSQYSFTTHALQWNILVNRWNKPDSQANVYLKSGAGRAYIQRDNNVEQFTSFAYAGVALDWETRRYFISYENQYSEFKKSSEQFWQATRVGWAPYIGDYGDWHTWCMLQLKHTPKGKDKLMVTPLLRFFRGVHLFEFGANNHGDALFNYIIRY